MSAMIMTGIVIVSLLYRPRTRVLRAVGWAGLGLFVIYLLNSYVLYIEGHDVRAKTHNETSRTGSGVARTRFRHGR